MNTTPLFWEELDWTGDEAKEAGELFDFDTPEKQKARARQAELKQLARPGSLLSFVRQQLGNVPGAHVKERRAGQGLADWVKESLGVTTKAMDFDSLDSKREATAKATKIKALCDDLIFLLEQAAFNSEETTDLAGVMADIAGQFVERLSMVKERQEARTKSRPWLPDDGRPLPESWSYPTTFS